MTYRPKYVGIEVDFTVWGVSNPWINLKSNDFSTFVKSTFSPSNCSAYQSKPSRLWTPAIVIDAMHLDAPEVVQLDHTVHVNISQWSSPGHMEPSKHGASGEHFKWVNFYGKQQHFHLY